MDNHQQILEKLKEIIKESGQKVLEFYTQEFGNAQQEEFPVTEVDLVSNKILIEGLSQFEGIGIFSEELKEDKNYLTQDKYFIIDPLDGTKDFVYKTGDFSIMLAIIENKQPFIGIVYQPTTKELFYAIKGEGAFVECDGTIKPLHVSTENDFSQMKLVVSRFHVREAEQALKEKLGIGDFQQKGSAGLKMCDVAQGLAHIYVSTTGKTGEWDSAPGALIAQEAGATVTDIYGNDLVFGKEEPYNVNGFVVSNGTRHGEVIKKLEEILKNDSTHFE